MGAKIQTRPDGQSPTGGASSSVNDVAKWIRLQFADGKFDGKQIVSEKPLAETIIRTCSQDIIRLRTCRPFTGWDGT